MGDWFCGGGRGTSGCGTHISVPQSGQSTRMPAASSSAFNFRPQDGQKKRISILQESEICLELADYMHELQTQSKIHFCDSDFMAFVTG
jgi:hypothetical protein